MQLKINDTVHDVPFDLSIITLEQYLAYYNKYGRELDKHLEQLVAKEFDGDQEDAALLLQIDIESHLDNEAISWFSYWTNIDLFEVKDLPGIQPLLSEYRVLRFLLKESSEQIVDLPIDVEWNGETWCIQDFKVNPASDMSFNEIITSKEVMRQIMAIGQCKWDSLPYLCAVFFRKKGEAFNDEMIYEGSERMELIKKLPMVYALAVAFFLTSCVNILNNTLVSLEEKEEETAKPN